MGPLSIRVKIIINILFCFFRVTKVHSWWSEFTLASWPVIWHGITIFAAFIFTEKIYINYAELSIRMGLYIYLGFWVCSWNWPIVFTKHWNHKLKIQKLRERERNTHTQRIKLVMINLKCVNLAWPQYPDILSNIILNVMWRHFLNEISI